MGTKVAATLDGQLKPSYTVSTVAAASFVVADTDLAIWIGNAVTLTKVEVINALNNCLAHIRENGSATPTGTNESYAEVGTTYRKDVNSAFDAAAAVPEEAKVGIWYGPDYQQTVGASITPGVKRLIEEYMESTQKAA